MKINTLKGLESHLTRVNSEDKDKRTYNLAKLADTDLYGETVDWKAIRSDAISFRVKYTKTAIELAKLKGKYETIS